ncbi:hypothetical protein [Stenotrophomonas sp. AB1(2024)]|uniref:hypothetical protein n=1 Tax=Stenotrophomonas sp. AB1(2024) TaxID=3132215 RepID=UPI003095D9B7
MAIPEWVTRGKTIESLIRELMTFEDKHLPVEISFDDGITSRPISLVGKLNGKCVLFNLEDVEGGQD